MRVWTTAEIAMLKSLYPTHTVKELEKIMNIPARLITGATKRYKIKSGRSGKFTAGHKSWNKGKSVRLNPRTEFKKGSLPNNTLYDGAIRLRIKHNGEKYYFIRIAQAQWKLLQRHVWEQANGVIPPGYIITFKDGNSLNCELDNLALISREENASRNRNRTKAAASLKALYDRERLRKKYNIGPLSGHYHRLKSA